METVKLEKKTEAELGDENKVKNEALTTELYFDLLKQYAWLSSAAIGAVIILVQLKTVAMDKGIYITLGLLGLSIFFSLLGKDYIVDSLLKGKNIHEISKPLGFFRLISIFCLALSVGYFSARLF